MRVFIGWSGPMSHGVAKVLRDKLPYILQTVDPFVSSHDINKGTLWSEELERELRDANFGIICITRYNINSPWLNFEAGTLSKGFRIAPFLFLVDRTRLRGGPLERFQSTAYDKDDMLELLTGINEAIDPKYRLKQDFLRTTFEHWWLELDAALQDVARRSNAETETGYRWLYSIGDLQRIVADLDSKCIMIVSPCPDEDFKLFFVRDMIKENLERGVSYEVLIAKSTGPSERRVIMDAFSSHPDKLSLTRIPDRVFEPLAVTHCCLLNYECDAPSLRVFLELPVKEQANQTEQAYWIEVDEFAARRFAQRFRDLRDRYKLRTPLQGQSLQVTSPGQVPPTPGAGGPPLGSSDGGSPA
jgi:hypothetical protein